MGKDFESLQIDIVLPCYNPGDQWLNELEKFHAEVASKYNINYFVVNDGSLGKAISELVESLIQKNINVQLIEYPINKGKGFALRTGVQKTKANYVIYTDIDFPFTNQSILNLISELITNDLDVVVGYRSDNYYQQKMSWFRKTLSTSFRIFIKQFLNMNITDTQCGLKGFNQKGKSEFLKTTINRYLFDFEFIYSVSNQPNIKIKAIEVQLKENVIFSKMKPKILLQETFNLVKILFSRK